MCVGCEIYISELVRSSKLYNGVCMYVCMYVIKYYSYQWG